MRKDDEDEVGSPALVLLISLRCRADIFTGHHVSWGYVARLTPRIVRTGKEP